MADDARDGLEVVSEDHRAVVSRFVEHRRQTDPARMQRGLEELVTGLQRHFEAEERHLYPAVRDRLPDGDTLADARLEEHEHARRTMRTLAECDPDTARQVALTHHLEWQVRRHFHQEETVVLPQLRAATGPELRRELGEALAGEHAFGPA